MKKLLLSLSILLITIHTNGAAIANALMVNTNGFVIWPTNLTFSVPQLGISRATNTPSATASIRVRHSGYLGSGNEYGQFTIATRDPTDTLIDRFDIDTIGWITHQSWPGYAFRLAPVSPSQYAIMPLINTNDTYLALCSDFAASRSANAYYLAYGNGTNWNIYNKFGNDGTNSVIDSYGGPTVFRNYNGSLSDMLSITNESGSAHVVIAGKLDASGVFSSGGKTGINSSQQVNNPNGTTNLLVYQGGILVSNIASYYAP